LETLIFSRNFGAFPKIFSFEQLDTLLNDDLTEEELLEKPYKPYVPIYTLPYLIVTSFAKGPLTHLTAEIKDV
jgi:hypothetical protein